VISSIIIDRLKRFEHLEIATRPLTVLTGLNGSGKTSILHGLMLARQAAFGSPAPRTVALNGPYGLALGEALDVLTQNADPARGIEVAVTDETGTTYRWQFGTGNLGERQTFLTVDHRPWEECKVLSGSPRRFAYLAAERLGPRDTLSAGTDDAETIGVGHAGEFTAQVLGMLDTPRWLVPERRREPNRTPKHQVYSLRRQTEWWMAEIVHEVEIEAQWYPGTNSLSIRFRAPGYKSDWTRPANTGFGLSYALPIIVAGLVTPSGGTLLIENPEAHLHPAGQSAMGAFLARISSDGVQVIVETHSDHLINGVRRAIAEQDVLQAGNAILHFFGNPRDKTAPQSVPIEILESGKLSAWPKGFFDQIDLDLAALARLKKSRK